MVRRLRSRSVLAALTLAAALGLIAAPLARADDPIADLIPGTAVLYTLTSSGSSSGNGGNTSSTTSSTNIFAPASYVDYHHIGGEPTTVVDRYLFGPGSTPTCAGFDAAGNPITTPECQKEAACSSGTTCYHDLVYVSNPMGVGYPGYSQFYKSSDGGQTFRVPAHNPYFTNEPAGTTEGGGGDSHQAVGQTTHSIFFVDLSAYCVTMNISRDLGESWSKNQLGCEANPGVIDDREWVAADETGGVTNVYMTVNNDTGCLVAGPGCSIVFVKSTDDGGANTPADFAASECNAGTMNLTPGVTSLPASACPDPSDPNFWIAGPIVADTSSSSPHWHSLYVPFERNAGGSDFQLWVAISRDQGTTWTQQEVADLGPHDPANIFPELTVDTAGNLYYTWSQAQGFNSSTPADEGETDVYYTYSQGGGMTGTWAPPIDLTKETGDSAVFPWMVAGSPGQVDLVLYKANTGLNPNIAYYDQNGQSCTPPAPAGSTCSPNTTVWNTYFGQSQNALNGGANFKIVQISDHPIHTGGVCTSGIACQSTPQQNRDLLDFLTIDVDHTGAAYTTWADDNNSRHDTRQFFSRQLAGASIFAGQNIAAMNAYPITNHAVSDPNNVVLDAAGIPEGTAGTCPGMDVLGTSEKSTNGLVTISLTLDGPPTSAAAIKCSVTGATGGVWGAEFWSSSNPVPGSDALYPNGNFYVAYRDNPPDGAPRVEAGYVDALSISLTHDEFDPIEVGTAGGTSLGGTCLTSAGVVNPAAPTPCTITLTASLTGLGIKSGAGLYSISGFSVYYQGAATPIPATRVPLGNSNLASIDTPFDDNGTGTTAQ